MDLGDYMRYVASLLFVIGLIVGLAWLVLRSGKLPMAHFGLRGKDAHRLAILEVRAIDARHRLVLVCCDGKEHLLLIGPDGQTVVDSDVGPSPEKAREGSQQV